VISSFSKHNLLASAKERKKERKKEQKNDESKQ